MSQDNDTRGRMPLSVESDIMQLARFGEIQSIQKLLDNKTVDVNAKDEEGVTPLHWAAIKNHYALCKVLVDAGANVNATGGDVQATPVLWAARSCNYYVVDLLLQYGADPLIADNQGFNLMQNATLDGNVFQLLAILSRDVPVDTPDSKGHTSLMWAAYKGFPACTEILLRCDASVAARDEQGFTALHWALVKGSQKCLQKLIEYDSDKSAITNDGKDPAKVARDMNSTGQWHRALSYCGYNPDGSPKQFPFAFIATDKRLFILRYFFLLPFVQYGCCTYLIAGLPVFVSVPFSMLAMYGSWAFSQKLLRWAPWNMKWMINTPYPGGVFMGLFFWLAVQYCRKVLPYTYIASPIWNIAFVVMAGLCLAFYYLSITADPGYIPRPKGLTEQRAVVRELVEDKIFDEARYCVKCMVHKPLRSKHCHTCDRCIAKFDHHCPFVVNCVGTNNHRHFVLFLVAMILGALVLLRLVVSYLEVLGPSGQTQCVLHDDWACDVLNRDAFTMTLMFWLIPTTGFAVSLLAAHIVLIGRGMTTFEVKRPMKQMSSTAEFITSAVTSGTTNFEEASLNGPGTGAVGDQTSIQTSQRWWTQCMTILGLDTAIALAMYGSNGPEIAARRRRNNGHGQNPFSQGCTQNYKDFFMEPTPIFGRTPNGQGMLGGEVVDYTTIYQPPRRKIIHNAYEAVPTGEV